MELDQLLSLWATMGPVAKVVGVLIVLHPIASIIVAATPTPRDNELYGKLYKFVLEPLALVVFRAKDKAK